MMTRNSKNSQSPRALNPVEVLFSSGVPLFIGESVCLSVIMLNLNFAVVEIELNERSILLPVVEILIAPAACFYSK